MTPCHLSRSPSWRRGGMLPCPGAASARAHPSPLVRRRAARDARSSSRLDRVCQRATSSGSSRSREPVKGRVQGVQAIDASLSLCRATVRGGGGAVKPSRQPRLGQTVRPTRTGSNWIRLFDDTRITWNERLKTESYPRFRRIRAWNILFPVKVLTKTARWLENDGRGSPPVWSRVRLITFCLI